MLHLMVFDLHDLRFFPKKKKIDHRKAIQSINRAIVIGFKLLIYSRWGHQQTREIIIIIIGQTSDKDRIRFYAR